MRITLATDPGHPGRPNEDFVAAAPGAVVVVDGAGIPGTEDICRHGVAWYSHTLGATLLANLVRGSVPAEALADAIDHVAGLHRHTCDLANPSSPQATVAAIRFGGDSAEHLALADTYVVLAPADGEPRVITDSREVAVRRECSATLAGLVPGSPDYEQALPGVIDALRARRNRTGGYWIAKDDPAAAAEAVTGREPLAGLDGVALLSNGAVRGDDWPCVVDLLRTDGPEALLRRVREAGTDPDDATVAWVSLPAGP